MTKKILLLGSGELGKEFVIAAKRKGQYVIACDSYAGAPAMQVADEFEVFSMLDGDALDAVVAKHKPDIIVPEIEPTRLRLLWALCEGDRCVSELSDKLGMGQSAISHQLRLLRQARLVRFHREGKTSVYSLDDDHVRLIFELGLSHIREEGG